MRKYFYALFIISAMIINTAKASVIEQGKQISTAALSDSVKKDQPKPAPKLINIRVTDAYNGDSSQLCRVKFQDEIIVKVKGFDSLLKKVRLANKDKSQIKLFLNGRQIDGIVPVSGAPQKDEGELTFRLQRNDTNNVQFAELLGAPKLESLFTKTVKVSIGLNGSYAEASDVKNFKIVRLQKGWFYLCLVSYVAWFVLLIYLARRSGMLRDTPVNLAALNLPSVENRPYSLARVQMAFWFSIVIASFLFIWLITNNYNIINNDTLILIGISGATALSAVAIDTNKGQEEINAIKELQARTGVINSEIVALNQAAQPGYEALISTRQNELAQIDADIKKRVAGLQLQSAGFFKDLLNDVNGVSFHRLQMFTWTIILAMVFIYDVWLGLSMPDFSATLLTLQGITSSTYLGFKFPEKAV